VAKKYERAETDYLSGMKYKDIATKYGVTIDAVKAWRKRHWSGAEKPAQKERVQKKQVQKKSTQAIGTKILAGTKVTLDETELTEKEQLFCLYWINNRNATQAYLKAFGSSYVVAHSRSSLLMTKNSIRTEINRLREIRAKTILLGPDDVLDKMMRIAFADMTDVSSWGTKEVPAVSVLGVEMYDLLDEPIMLKENFVHFKDSSMIDGALVTQISNGPSGIKVKLADQQKALEWLADYFGMNPAHKQKVWFDKKKIELDERRVQVAEKGTNDDDKPIEILIKRKER